MMRSRGRHHVKAVGFSKDRNENVFAALRIGVGIFFLVFGEYKVFGTQFTLGRGFQAWINRFIAHGAYPFMVPVLRKFVLPHATAIAEGGGRGKLGGRLGWASGLKRGLIGSLRMARIRLWCRCCGISCCRTLRR